MVEDYDYRIFGVHLAYVYGVTRCCRAPPQLRQRLELRKLEEPNT